MTRGWLDGERNIWKQYCYAVRKYGKETGEEIFGMMFGNYSCIGILDAHACPMEPVKEETERIAKALGLTWEVFDASVDYLKELLTGPRNSRRFLNIKKGCKTGFPI